MLALLTLPVQKEPDLGPCAQRMLALWPDLSIGLLGCEIAKVAAGARSDPPPVNAGPAVIPATASQHPVTTSSSHYANLCNLKGCC